MPDPAQRPLLTVAEVAALMPGGVGEKAVRAAIAAGQLPSTRVGRYVLVPTAALRRQLGLDDDQPLDMREAGEPTPALALHAPAATKRLESA